MSQRTHVRQGPRRAAHAVNSTLRPRLCAGIVCLLVAAALGDGAWHLFNAHERTVADHAVKQTELYRAVPVTQTLSKPAVALTAQLTPASFASAGEAPVIVRKAAMSGAPAANSKPNIAQDVESTELTNIRPNIAQDVEDFKSPTAPRQAPTTGMWRGTQAARRAHVYNLPAE